MVGVDWVAEVWRVVDGVWEVAWDVGRVDGSGKETGNSVWDALSVIKSFSATQVWVAAVDVDGHSLRGTGGSEHWVAEVYEIGEVVWELAVVTEGDIWVEEVDLDVDFNGDALLLFINLSVTPVELTATWLLGSKKGIGEGGDGRLREEQGDDEE